MSLLATLAPTQAKIVTVVADILEAASDIAALAEGMSAPELQQKAKRRLEYLGRELGERLAGRKLPVGITGLAQSLIEERHEHRAYHAKKRAERRANMRIEPIAA